MNNFGNLLGIPPRILAVASLCATGACVSTQPYFPIWDSNKISLGATASGRLAVQDGCVVVVSDRVVMPVWPNPTRMAAAGIITPSGQLIPYGTEVTLVGAYGQEGTRYWHRARDCGAVSFSVNRDGIAWTENSQGD